MVVEEIFFYYFCNSVIVSMVFQYDVTVELQHVMCKY